MKEEKTYVCPKCHSENIQSLPLVYTSGVSTTNARTTGIGITSSLNLGVGTATTSAVNVSQLAKNLRPPEEKHYIRTFFIQWFIALVVVSIVNFIILNILMAIFGEQTGMTSGSFVSLVLLIASVVWGYTCAKKDYKWNQEIYPRYLREWKHTFICLRCGHRFVIE